MIHVFSGWYCNGWSVTVCIAGDKWSWGLNIFMSKGWGALRWGYCTFFWSEYLWLTGLVNFFDQIHNIVWFYNIYRFGPRLLRRCSPGCSFILSQNSKIVLDFGWDIELLMCLKWGLWYLRITWVHPYCNMRRMTSRVKCNGFVTLEL